MTIDVCPVLELIPALRLETLKCVNLSRHKKEDTYPQLSSECLINH